MMRQPYNYAAFLTLCLTCGAAAVSQSTTSPADTTSQAGATSSASAAGAAGAMGSASAADKKFAEKAMQGGMAEVQLGQLATQKASADDVKKFGQQMVDDHTKLNTQMQQLAPSLGVTPPAGPDAKHQALQAKLEGLSGDAFDKAYIKAMVMDHKKDLADFKKEAASGQNPQLKEAAQQGSTVIQSHLQMVEGLASSHNVKAGGGKAGL
jgi:putative membrane protein